MKTYILIATGKCPTNLKKDVHLVCEKGYTTREIAEQNLNKAKDNIAMGNEIYLPTIKIHIIEIEIES
jgi:hypothetical protein